MGDVSSKELRIPSLLRAVGTDIDSRRHYHQYQAPSWYQSLFVPLKTSCDDAPLPPPPLPPSLGSPSPPPPLASPAVAPPPPPTAEQDSISAAAESVAAIPNPGSYENSSVDVRRLIMLDTHDGFRCEVNKQLNPFLNVGHSFWLGTMMLPDGRNNNYTLITQVGNESGVVFARVDPNRPSVDARIINAGPPLPFRLQVQVTGEGQSDQALLECDVGNQTWSANLKYGSMGGGVMWGCNFFQSITPRLAVGGEGMFIGVNNSFLSSYTLKYTMPARTGEEAALFQPTIPGTAMLGSDPAAPVELKGSSTFWANMNLSQSMLTLSYLRVVTPQRVTVAAELQCNPLTLDSQVTLGAEFKFLRQKISTAIDGSGRIQSIVETKLDKAPGSPTLSFSAELDHGKELTRFGYGITFES